MTDQPASPQGPLAGWYASDSTGRLRWWDGQAWGPFAPAEMQSRTIEDTGKIMAVLSWLGFFVAYFLVALVVRVSEKNGNRFARWHAAEALNLQLTFVLLWNVLLGPTVVLSFSTGDHPPVVLFVATILIAMALFAASGALCILGAVKASRGEWWRCRVSIPFLRLHRRERAAAVASAPPLP